MVTSVLPLLIVAAVGTGGPPGVQPATHLRNATVTVEQIEHGHRRVVATSPDGVLARHVRPGVYILVARLRDNPEHESPQPNCASRAVRVHRNERRVSIRLGCSTK